MIFLDRSRRGKDPYLKLKMALFWMGAALALLGIGLESSLLVNVAIAVLLGGFLLRFLPSSSSSSDDDEHADEDDEDDEDDEVGDEHHDEVGDEPRD